jgi:hypothetical protein
MPLRTSGKESVCLFSVAGLWIDRHETKKARHRRCFKPPSEVSPATTGTCEFGQLAIYVFRGGMQAEISANPMFFQGCCRTDTDSPAECAGAGATRRRIVGRGRSLVRDDDIEIPVVQPERGRTRCNLDRALDTDLPSAGWKPSRLRDGMGLPFVAVGDTRRIRVEGEVALVDAVRERVRIEDHNRRVPLRHDADGAPAGRDACRVAALGLRCEGGGKEIARTGDEESPGRPR